MRFRKFVASEQFIWFGDMEFVTVRVKKLGNVCRRQHIRLFAVLLLLSLNFGIPNNFKSAFQMCHPTFYVRRTIRFPRILATDLQPTIIETTYNAKYRTLLLRRKQWHLQ